MSNNELQAIWREIESIAKADLEYIESLPDEKKEASKYLQHYNNFLSSRFRL